MKRKIYDYFAPNKKKAPSFTKDRLWRWQNIDQIHDASISTKDSFIHINTSTQLTTNTLLEHDFVLIYPIYITYILHLINKSQLTFLSQSGVSLLHLANTCKYYYKQISIILTTYSNNQQNQIAHYLTTPIKYSLKTIFNNSFSKLYIINEYENNLLDDYNPDCYLIAENNQHGKTHYNTDLDQFKLYVSKYYTLNEYPRNYYRNNNNFTQNVFFSLVYILIYNILDSLQFISWFEDTFNTDLIPSSINALKHTKDIKNTRIDNMMFAIEYFEALTVKNLYNDTLLLKVSFFGCSGNTYKQTI